MATDARSFSVLCTSERANMLAELPFELIAMIAVAVARSAHEKVDDEGGLILPSDFFAMRSVARLWNNAVLSALNQLVKKNGLVEYAKYTRLCLPLRRGQTLQGLLQTLRAAPLALLSTITTCRWYKTQDVGLRSFESTCSYMVRITNGEYGMELKRLLVNAEPYTHSSRKWNEYVYQLLRERSLLSDIRCDEGQALSQLFSLLPQMSIFEAHTSTIWPNRDFSDLRISQTQLHRELGTLLPLLLKMTATASIQSLILSNIETRALEYIPKISTFSSEHLTSISFDFAPVEYIYRNTFHQSNSLDTPYTSGLQMVSCAKLYALLASAHNLKSLALWWHDPISLLPIHGSTWLANVLDRQYWPCLQYFSIESIPSPAPPLLRVLSAHKATLRGVCLTNVETLEDTREKFEAYDRLIWEMKRLKLRHARFNTLTYEDRRGRRHTMSGIGDHFWYTQDRELAALAGRPHPDIASTPPISDSDLAEKLNKWLGDTGSDTIVNDLTISCGICKKNARLPSVSK